MTWLLGAYSDPRTYRNAAYMLLGLGLGIFHFVLLVTGFSLGLGLLITLLGIPLLVATLLVARGLAAMERELARSWLDAPVPRRRLSSMRKTGLSWARLKELVASGRTWSEVVFLLLRLPMSILDFAFIVTLLGLMFGGFALPVTFLAGLETQIGSWTIDSFSESLLAVPFSAVFLVVGGRLLTGWAGLSRRMASHFLGRLDVTDLKYEVADILVRHGSADALFILGELELRLGQGPFLTPTRVEATLLALQSSGRIEVSNAGQRTTYALVDNS